MTFKEYCDQKDPQKLPLFSVALNPLNCLIFYDVLIIEIKSKTYTYFLDTDTGHIYTRDKDGNKNKPTVFYLQS